MSEEAEASFILQLREAAAHCACRNARSVEAEMGGSDDGNAHATASIDTSTDFLGTGFLPFFSKQARRKVSSAKFWLLCRGHTCPTRLMRKGSQLPAASLAYSSLPTISLLFSSVCSRLAYCCKRGGSISGPSSLCT
jgi:hypothetical protein